MNSGQCYQSEYFATKFDLMAIQSLAEVDWFSRCAESFSGIGKEGTTSQTQVSTTPKCGFGNLFCC